MFEQTVVFRQGEHGVNIMRIPGMAVTTAGTILAFCEARDAGDRSPTDLVMKRSEDGGRTWGPLQLVLKAPGMDAMMNPCPVVDPESGTVFSFAQRFPEGDREAHHQPGFVRTVVSRSTDDGITWSDPEDITACILDEKTEYGKVTGPGVGICMSTGRLVVPFGLGPEEACQATVLYSDDKGATWTSGARTPARSSETAVVELSDGSLRLDMRNQRPQEKPDHCRYYALSTDGGETWTEPTKDKGLRDVTCQASMVSGRIEGQWLVLFSNPDSDYANRINMTVKVSRDDGKTWPVASTVHAGPCAYSCLGMLADGAVGLLYEGGDEHRYKAIRFARFSMDWLEGKTNG